MVDENIPGDVPSVKRTSHKGEKMMALYVTVLAILAAACLIKWLMDPADMTYGVLFIGILVATMLACAGGVVIMKHDRDQEKVE